MAGKKDLKIYQGATFRFSFTLTQYNNGTETPVDLSECVPRMQIRPSHNSETLHLDLEENGFITISDPVNGEVAVDIPATSTQELYFSSAVYDIELEFPDGYVMRMVEGRVTLSPEVTR